MASKDNHSVSRSSDARPPSSNTESKETLFGQISFAFEAVKEWFEEVFVEKPSVIIQIFVGVLIAVIIMLLYNLIRLIVQRTVYGNKSNPYIVKTTKDATIVLRLPQDPNDSNSVPLQRSFNEAGGIEFSYVLWMFINDFNYKYGEWKHVFHKGNSSSWPNRSPGVWIHPSKNALRIYMNTYTKISEMEDIEDIPIQKWFHLGLVVRNDSMDIYINGYLKKRHLFSGKIPKQNFGDLWVNANGGFNGYISRMQYFDYAVPFSAIENAISIGPSMSLPNTAIQRPPYFNNTWWLK